MGPSAKDPGMASRPLWTCQGSCIQSWRGLAVRRQPHPGALTPKKVSLGGPGMVTTVHRGRPPTTTGSCCFLFSRRCAVATSPRPRKTRGGAMDVGRSPKASGSAPSDAQVWLPPALMHFPCSVQSLPSPRLPQATALASTPVGCSPSPATGVAPPLSWGRRWG